MPVVIPPGFAQFSIEHWLVNYTRPAVTVWGLALHGDVFDPDDMADTLLSIYATNLSPGFDSNVTLRDCKIVIGQDGGDPVVGQSTTQFNGAAVRESTAPALACLIRLNTGLGGRRNRGRKFLPWALSDNSVSEMGAVEPSAVNGWNTRMANFQAGIELTDWRLALLHGTGSTPVPPPTEITNMTCSPVVSTQRRRQARF